MEIFEIIGTVGFIFALISYSRVDALEKKLKDLGVLDREFASE